VLRGRAQVETGRFFDGTRFRVSASPTWSLSRHLELEASVEYNRVRFGNRAQEFDVYLGRLRAQLGFSTRVSLNGFIQFNSAADLVSSNVRFRYNVAEGNDLWLVYNTGLNMDRTRDFPALPVSAGRALLLKYTHTFAR
jgi:hypothetical protein